ncbi:MAG: cytidine deaminase [Spirochaetota bacterium]
MQRDSHSDTLTPETRTRLIDAAKDAARSSYAPYSRFHVGAALLCPDGTIVPGTNVENRSYGLAICAERSAIATAVTSGCTSFHAIAVFSPDADYPVSPCGACRQVISEFMPPEALVIFVDRNGREEPHTVAEILPFDALHELRDRPID